VTIDRVEGVDVIDVDSRRERKKQETHQRLLVSAWGLFRERGYDDTTVEAITEAADVAKSTFFNYFPTKEAIVDEIALWRIDRLGSRVLGADDVPARVVGRIKLLMSAMADELAPEDELTRHLFAARISAPIKRESAHRIGSLMQELITQAQARHEIRADVDAGLLARLLMTCFFYSVLRWHHHDGRHPDDPPDPSPLLAKERANAAVDALMDGLGGPEWRKM
jgi:AcrR family transcriptional regulator